MEKTLFAQTGEIRGKKSSDHLTLSFQYSPAEDHLKQTRGMLFFLVQVKIAIEEKGMTEAKEIFDTFRNKFYAIAGGNLKALEETIDFLKDELRRRGLEADILAANLWGSVVYLGKMGRGGFILVRNGQGKKIEVGKIASGVMIDKDTLLLTNSFLPASLDLETISRLCAEENFEEALKSFSEELKEKEGDAFCVRLTVQEPVASSEPVLVADLDHPKIRERDLKKEIDLVASLEEKEPFILKLQKNLRKWIKKIQETARPTAFKGYYFARELTRRASFVALSPWLPQTVGSGQEQTARKRQRIFQIVLVLGVILVGSILIGVFNHTRSVRRENYERVVSLVERKIEDATNLQNINNLEVASLLEEAKKELAKLDAKDEKVKSLRERIGKLLAEASRIFSVKLSEFVDLSTLKGGINTTDVKISGSSLFVLDSGTGSIYKVSSKEAEPKILLSEKEGLQNFSLMGGFIYAQTKSEVLKIDIETGTETTAASSSSDWRELIAAATYRGNLYLLDSSAKQIWKHVAGGEGLSSPSGYFAGEFKEAPVSFAVDGSVWVATKNKVLKYFGGNKAEFSVKNQAVPFENIARVFTNEGLTNLYILDKGAGGVFVIKKDSGEYLGFYKSGDLSDAESIAVNEPNKRVYVLAGEKISSFKLR